MIGAVIGGCRIELKFSCFALLAFFCIFAGVSGGAFFFAAAVIHESCHLVLLFLFHAPPKAAVISCLGCRLILDPQRRLSYRKNAAVSLAGPAGNLLAFCIAAAFGASGSVFAETNLALCLLHLIPVEPLDGGLALHAVLCSVAEEHMAGKLAAAVSILFLIPLAVLGFLILLRTRGNFSLLVLSVYLMLYLVLKHDYLDD